MAVDLSIVVVHWNVPDLLRACLASICAETESEFAVTIQRVNGLTPGQKLEMTQKKLDEALALLNERGIE